MAEGAILIPIYNERLGLEGLLRELDVVLAGRVSENWEVFLVDDGSTDESLEYLQQEASALTKMPLTIISLSRNFGQQAALLAGLNFVREKDFVCILDADLQDPPALIDDFMEKYRAGYEVVYGIRKHRKGSALKRFLYWGFYRIFHQVSEFPIPLDSGDFCLISKPVVNALSLMDERDIFLRGLRGWVGFRQVGVSYDRPERAFGDEKYSYRKLFSLALSAFYGFSWFPIRFATVCGLGSVTIALIYFANILFGKLSGATMPPGWASIISIIVFFGGIQLITLGILGEYIGRIYKQVLPRPSYVVRTILKINAEDE
jgi:glycosyltransferase involved in cell wall biosynthesis